MYVCICNAITDKEIRLAAKAGARDLWTLQRELGVASGCGGCMETAAEILRETAGTVRRGKPKVYRPAVAYAR